MLVELEPLDIGRYICVLLVKLWIVARRLEFFVIKTKEMELQGISGIKRRNVFGRRFPLEVD